MVVWVAIGGRTSIYGAVIGALFVSWGKTSFSESRPDDWLYIQGLLFVVVVAFFPGGIVGVLHSLARLVSAPFRRWRKTEAPDGVTSDADGEPDPRAGHRDGDMTVPVLELRDLAVSFDGFKALDGVNLVVNEGELRFLIGPNGAGQDDRRRLHHRASRSPTSGEILFRGRSIRGMKEHRIVRLGIGRSFQTPTVFEALSVIENLDLAATFRRRFPRLLRQRTGVLPEVSVTLERIGLTQYGETPAKQLSHGQKQWLEIGMLLVQGPDLLLLDEPVAGMSPQERQATGELLQQLAQDHTVVVIEHDMAFLRRFAHRVTVLHEGQRARPRARWRRCRPTPGCERSTWVGRATSASGAVVDVRGDRTDEARGRGPAGRVRPHRGAVRRLVRGRRRRLHVPDGAQRRRQDHVAERGHGRAARRGPGASCSTAATSPSCPPTSGPAPGSVTSPRAIRCSRS